MAYRVRAKIKGRPGTRITVEEGAIFEVADLSSSSPQTLRVLGAQIFTIDSTGVAVFDVDTECLNPSRPAPSRTPMRPTPFVKP
jgi:hypothetical protein